MNYLLNHELNHLFNNVDGIGFLTFCLIIFHHIKLALDLGLKWKMGPEIWICNQVCKSFN